MAFSHESREREGFDKSPSTRLLCFLVLFSHAFASGLVWADFLIFPFLTFSRAGKACLVGWLVLIYIAFQGVSKWRPPFSLRHTICVLVAGLEQRLAWSMERSRDEIQTR